MPIDRILKNKYTYDDIYNAYKSCRKSKRNSQSALEFEPNYEVKLLELLNEINNGTYKIGSSNVFAISDPKPREVWAANFRDRIVHHLLINNIQEYFEKRFITDSYSCIKGRGTLKAIQKAVKCCRSVTENWQHDGCFIKLDIKNFFGTIDKHILWKELEKTLGNESLTARLTKQILFNDILENPNVFKQGLEKVPSHKSLLQANNPDVGLPIGNLSSQFFSNVYLDGLDKFCKHILKIKHYIRYADDILIIVKDLSDANYIIEQMSNWLYSNRNQAFNTNKTIKSHIKNGIHFLGSIIYEWHLVPSKRLIKRYKQAVKCLKKNYNDSKALASINSYMGMTKHYCSKHFNYQMLKDFVGYFRVNERRIARHLF